MRRLLALFALTTVLSSLLLGTAASGASASVPRATSGSALQVGVQFKGMWSDYSDTQRAQVLDKLAAAGVDTVRIDVSWAMLQPNGPSSYSSWGVDFLDKVLHMATSRGLTPLVTLWMTPGWANGGAGERALPSNPADYARVAGWAAKRWAGVVGAWEIWNEPNSNDFLRGADPAAYTRLLRAAYPAIKQGDPAAKVVFGGTMYVDTAWITRAYAAGAHGYFDALAVHPYMGVASKGPETADDGTEWTMDHVRALRRLMVDQGDSGKSVWFTEFGWSSHSNTSTTPNWQLGVTEQQQGDLIVRAYKHIATNYPYVARAYYYTEREQVDSHVQDNHYGLLYHGLTPKPAYYALSSYLHSLPTTVGTTAARTATPAVTARRSTLLASLRG